jgi:hypothetical protein
VVGTVGAVGAPAGRTAGNLADVIGKLAGRISELPLAGLPPYGMLVMSLLRTERAFARERTCEAVAMTHSLGENTQDAERWWQAYQLAEIDQDGELRERAEAGDEHARRQLASWLADRVRTQEAIKVIRPLADAGDDVAERWLARWLADCDQPGELRQRAAAGSYHALVELAGWLAGHERLDELRDLVVGHRELLSGWLAAQHGMHMMRLAADLGDDDARSRLEMTLARLHERAASGNVYARQALSEWPH